MNASSVPRMVLVNRTVPVRRLACHALYHHSLRRAAARRPTLAVLPAPARFQPHLHRRRLPPRLVHRLLPPLLPSRRLLGPGHRAVPRDHSQGHPQGLAQPRRPVAPPQPRLERRGAALLASPPAAGRHRPGVDPLPRPADARLERGLPRAGQERHQSLPRLRHRLRQLPRPTLHLGPDDGRARREDARGSQATAQAGVRPRHQRAYAVGGSGASGAWR